MRTTAELLLAEIEAYLARTGETATKFGLAAVRDGHLVSRLRKGESVTLKTADKVRAYMSQAAASDAAPAASTGAGSLRRILLVMGGRHRGLQVPRPDPALARTRHRHARGDDGCRAAVRDAAVRGCPQQRARAHGPVRSQRRAGDRPHPPFARGRPDRRGARNGGSHRAHGARPRQRSRYRRAARQRQADSGRARDEPAYVAPPGDATQRRPTRSRRGARDWSCRRRDGRAG